MTAHELYGAVQQADVDGLGAALGGKADDDAVVHSSGDESIAGVKTVPPGPGNSWIFNQPPQIAVGTQSYHAVRRDDARLADTRTPTPHASTHGSGGSDPVTPAGIGAAFSGHTHDLSGYVPTSRTLSAGTGLSGGGALTQDRSLAVSYGTTSGTACQGNDSRLSDARTPTAHTHSAADVISGTLSPDRLPLTTGTPAAATVGSSTTLDASAGSVRDLTCTSSTLAFGVPTNPTNRQVLRVAVKRSTSSAVTVNLNGSIRLSTGLSSRALSVAAGEVLLFALEYSSLVSAWVLTASTVSVA